MRRSVSLLSQVKIPEPARRPEIKLSTWEAKIFRFLRRVAAVSNTSEPVELRIAGGWVRDKLLDRPTGDIDIAVQNTTGHQFASRVHSFALAKAAEFAEGKSKPGEFPKVGSKEYVPDISPVAVIPAKPSMSRHLETAKLRLDGQDLDFVQLRTEDYALSADHRIPHSVAGGTPEEDAARRDFTVNALFYNLQTQNVEDFTGHGLDDLAQGVLRTPLDANITLLEDPLRALRAIRFACRLQFDLHPSLCDALVGKQVRESLLRKVSRERVGSEIDQILDSPGIVRGLGVIARCRLVEPVFMESFKSKTMSDESNYLQGLDRVRAGLEIVQDSEDLFTESEISDFRQHGQRVLIYSLLLSDTTQVRKMLQDALKRTKRLQQDVRLVMLLSIRLEDVVRKWYAVDNVDEERMEEELWVEIAEIVRTAGDRLWLAVVVACGVKIGNDELIRDLVNSGVCATLCGVAHAVDGKRLQAELGIPPGPEVGKALSELIRLQLWHYRRRGTSEDPLSGDDPVPSPEVCIELLKARLLSAESGFGR